MPRRKKPKPDCGETYLQWLNLTDRPVDVTPTMRVMPYDGKKANIGEPDLKIGNICLKSSRQAG